VWRYFDKPAIGLAVAVLVGGAAVFSSVPSLVQKGMKFDFGISFSHPGIRAVAALMVPRFFGIGIGQINFFVDTYFANAAIMPRGSLTALYVADRVMELVLGGYAIAVATGDFADDVRASGAADGLRGAHEDADVFGRIVGRHSLR